MTAHYGYAETGGLDGDEILAGPFEGNLAIGCVDARLSEAPARVGGHPEPATLTANELGPQEVDDRVMVKIQVLRGTAVQLDFQTTAPGYRAIPFEDWLVDDRHEATRPADDGHISLGAGHHAERLRLRIRGGGADAHSQHKDDGRCDAATTS